MKATAQQLNTAQLKVILKWVAGGNEDGLPNEIRQRCLGRVGQATPPDHSPALYNISDLICSLKPLLAD